MCRAPLGPTDILHIERGGGIFPLLTLIPLIAGGVSAAASDDSCIDEANQGMLEAAEAGHEDIVRLMLSEAQMIIMKY